MAVIDSIKDKNGNIIYPKTLTKAVYEEGTNRRLDNILADLASNEGALYTAGSNIQISEANVISATDTNTVTSINGKTGVIAKADIVALGIPASDTNTTYTAGAGLTLTGTVFTPTFGTTVGTVAQGNDSRFTNARTPLAHSHSIEDLPSYPTLASLGASPTIHNHTVANITDFPLSLPANGGNADTVGGFTVGISVPANAKFTDTNTTYSEISEAEINTGTASTLRTITARRVTFIINKIKGALTKADVGLGNVDNTSDANKPISTATQTALNGKLNTNHAFTWGNLKGM